MPNLVQRDFEDLAQFRSEPFERDAADRCDLGIESGPPAQDAQDELAEEILLARRKAPSFFRQERCRPAAALEDLSQDVHGAAPGVAARRHQAGPDRPSRTGSRARPRRNSAPETGVFPSRWTRRRRSAVPPPAPTTAESPSLESAPGSSSRLSGRVSAASSFNLSPPRKV